jgi:titin
MKTRSSHLALIPVIVFLVILLAAPQVARGAPAASFAVNTTGDASDLAAGDGACDSDIAKGDQCTLRAAIQETNALNGRDTITLGLITVYPQSELPALTDTRGTIIQGNGVSSVLDGISAGTNANGLKLESNNNIIQGLIVQNFGGFAIRIWWVSDNLVGTNGDGSNDTAERNVIASNGTGGILLMGGVNRVSGNRIGTNSTGTAASANGQGIYVEGALDCGTVIGTDGDGTGDAAEGNLISGNTDNGISIHNSCVAVAGNIIGLNASGSAALPNENGIYIWEIADGTLIGTDGDGVSDALERNILSGNTSVGVRVSILDGKVTIAGNYIGINPAGDMARPNDIGVAVGSTDNVWIGTNGDTIGDAVEGNVISGNARFGVMLEGSGATANVVAGNKIGTNPAGTSAIPNGQNGVNITNGAHHNRIGSDGNGQSDTAERNLISGNPTGILLGGSNTHSNVVGGNFIGVNAAGDAGLGSSTGVGIQDASQNIIGGAVGNLISGNTSAGISIGGATAISNTVAGNTIGLNASGMGLLANHIGVLINAPRNLVGTNGDGVNDTAERNIISGNQLAGVELFQTGATANVVAGNYIGTSPDGLSAFGNNYGVWINGAPGNLVGTDGNGVADAAERNIISGNQTNGVQIVNTPASGNVVAGNYIGINASGTAALKNGKSDYGVGVYVGDAPSTRIGTDGNGVADAAERNIISGNNTGGIYVGGEVSIGTVIAGNYIGTDPSGLTAIPNGTGAPDQAVMLSGLSSGQVGTNGDGIHDTAERNVIAGNLGWGIRVFEKGSDLLIAGNSIGVNANGAVLGNSKSGIFLHMAYGVKVGGVTSAMQNIIANNGGGGIVVGWDSSSTAEVNNILRGNALYANTGLGIDLGGDGVTANDPADADSGPNALQNYPILSTATSAAATTTITGTLNSKPNTSFWIDFYASPACDASGCGEGQVYLGSYIVTTDASGNASFVAALPVTIQDGAAITATATGSDKGETSEFSPCVIGVVTEYRIYLPQMIR